MADFGTFVCHLQAVTPMTIDNQRGEAIHAQFFRWLETYSMALRNELHDPNDHKGKPFTVSDLMMNQAPLRGYVERGATAWIQFTGLRKDVVEFLHQRLLVSPPAGIEIDRVFWVLNSVELTRQTTIEAMLKSHQVAKAPHHLQFNFLTATAFRRNGLDFSIPTPMLIFSTLKRRWEELSDFALPEVLNIYTDYFVAIEDFTLNSEFFTLQKTTHRAFRGRISYEIMKVSDQIKKEQEKKEDVARLAAFLEKHPHGDLARSLGLLAEFATYAGIGKKTTQGMGMVQLT
jgi:CRISPR-associated endoribonuclease Cas6